ncbi:MAG TPA: hypothetical protein VIK32_07730, partial [Candidatus Limnocylindrales bacterium]
CAAPSVSPGHSANPRTGRRSPSRRARCVLEWRIGRACGGRPRFRGGLNGTIAPILMFFIFRIGNDEKIMGRFTNPRWVNVFGWIATALMGVGAVTLVAMMALGY